MKRKLLRPMRVPSSHYQLASDLVATYGPNRQIRTLDALQLAVALKAHRTQPFDGFVCADQRLCDVAALEGLVIVNPR